MKTLRILLAAATVGVIVLAFRDVQRGVWLRPALPAEPEPSEREPILGYDGMDQETLLEWIDDAGVDEVTIARIAEYEEANRNRQPVLDALQDLLG